MAALEAVHGPVAGGKQQPHHGLVLQAVLQCGGEARVAHWPKVKISVGTGGQQQSHKVVAAGAHRHQEAAQRVQLCLGASGQEQPCAIRVGVGHGEVKGAPAQVPVACGCAGAQLMVDIEAAGQQQPQALGVAALGSAVQRALA